jgi:hypothetical protein
MIFSYLPLQTAQNEVCHLLGPAKSFINSRDIVLFGFYDKLVNRSLRMSKTGCKNAGA